MRYGVPFALRTAAHDNGGMELELVRPTVDYRESYLEALNDWRAEGLSWHLQ